MKPHVQQILFLVLLTLFPVSQSFSRVGESRSQLEGRLTKDRIGMKYPDNVFQKKKENKSLPYKNLVRYFPAESDVVAYYKKGIADKVDRADMSGDKRNWPGWDLIVVYMRDQSVFECYRRNDRNISDFEFNAILNLNKGASHWISVKEKAAESAFNYQYMLFDQSLRVFRKGKYLMIFRPEFDHLVYKNRIAQEEVDAEEAKEQTPASVFGF